MELSQGAYTIQGNNVLDLAQQFGTPLYIYDGEKIAHQIKTLRNAFSDVDIRVKYAAKALTNISVLKLIRKHGAGIEVVSLGEAQIAMKAGYTPAEIVFTPSGVDFSEIVEGVELGLAINIDNLVILSHASNNLRRLLSDAGFEVVQTELSEFKKAGGAGKPARPPIWWWACSAAAATPSRAPRRTRRWATPPTCWCARAPPSCSPRSPKSGTASTS